MFSGLYLVNTADGANEEDRCVSSEFYLNRVHQKYAEKVEDGQQCLFEKHS